MQIATGTVVNGKIEIAGVSLPQGAVVAVVARRAREPFVLSLPEEDELIAAIGEVQRGEFVSLEKLLDTLPKQSWP